MPKEKTDNLLDQALKDSPQHITRLIELRGSIAEARAEYLDAAEHAKECKKTYEGARQKFENYLKDLVTPNMFDGAKGGKEAKVKTEQTELQPVWPFPLPDDLRSIGLGDVSMNPNVKSFSAMIVGSLGDKGLKTAGDVEKFCCGDGKFTDPTLAKAAIEKFLNEIGKRQGAIVLNALADVKAKWKPEAGKTKDWPFPVDAPLCDHSISQVANKYPKLVTTAAATKLAEANVTTISDLNTKLAGGDSGFLIGIIGPGPAKKLIEAIVKYVEENK